MRTIISFRLLAFSFCFICWSTLTAQSFVMSQLLPNNTLRTPWELTVGPSGQLWVTEREPGSVMRVNPFTGSIDRLVTIPNVVSASKQDGLLGMAIDPDITNGSPYVYFSYTYSESGDRRQRLVRYTFSEADGNGVLSDELVILDNLPASNDHNSGRLEFGPDGKLYYTIGDQGGNQNRNYCNPILSQVLPTQAEVDVEDWSNYPGKTLRINPDGSIPDDNPVLDSVRSHVFTYGHRNAQGLVFGSNGRLYSDEHGPDTDDEVNLLEAGMNYGWPRVVGLRDDQAYDYCDWSSLDDCAAADYDKFNCPDGATFLEENTFTPDNYREPLAAMFAVTDDYDFGNPACGGGWLCRPNVAPSSLGIYESDAIPEWTNSLLVTSLKRGRIYRYQLSEDGASIVGDTTEHFNTINRYRDIAVSPNGKVVYIITDQNNAGGTESADPTSVVRSFQNPATILAFTLESAVSTTGAYTDEQFRAWPNPVNDRLNVVLGPDAGHNMQAELINVKGQVVRLATPLVVGANSLSVRDYPAGIYSLRLSDGQRNWVKRIVIN